MGMSKYVQTNLRYKVSELLVLINNTNNDKAHTITRRLLSQETGTTNGVMRTSMAVLLAHCKGLQIKRQSPGRFPIDSYSPTQHTQLSGKPSDSGSF